MVLYPRSGLAGKYMCSGRFDSIGNQFTVDSYTLTVTFCNPQRIKLGSSVPVSSENIYSLLNTDLSYPSPPIPHWVTGTDGT